MTTIQHIYWIALPNGVVTDDGTRYLRLSVFASPRLRTDQDAMLSHFPDFLDWAARMQPDQVSFTVEADNIQVPATITSAPPNPELWKALFTPETRLAPYEFDDFTNRPIVSYPVSSVQSYVKTSYQEVALRSPFDTPIIRNGKSTESRSYLEEIFSELIELHQSLNVETEEQLSQLLSSSVERAREVARNRQVERHAGGELITPAGLHEIREFSDVSEAREADETKDAFYSAMLFHYRPANVDPVDLPDDSAAREHFGEKFDFHQMLAALSDFPQILRRLGLIIDIQVPVEKLIKLKDSTSFVRVIPSWKSVFPPGESPDQEIWTADYSPWTCEDWTTINGQEIFTASSRMGEVNSGLWIPGSSVELVQADIDSAALKTLNLASSLARMQKNRNSQPIEAVEQVGVPALRTKGISLVRKKNAHYYNDIFNSSASLNERLSSDRPELVELYAEDLMRGYRLDVCEERLGEWRSLHQRIGTYRTLNHPGLIPDIADEGFIQPSVASKPENPSSPPDPVGELYVHESLFTWDGWSLSAPRPGKSISRSSRAPDTTDPDTMPQHVSNTAMTGLEFETSFRVQDGTLPRLRFGQNYRLRVRTVDLAGNGLTLAEASAIEAGLGSSLPKDKPLKYNRFEPINPPELVPCQLYSPNGNLDDDITTAYTEGESLERLVIRSNFDQTTEEYATAQPAYHMFNERHVAAPKASLHLVETHGLLDEALDAKHTLPLEQAKARMQEVYRLAKREAGSMNDVSSPSVRFIRTGSDPDSKDGYAVHTEEQLLLPYLPDPWAAGVLFQGLPGMAPNELLPIAFGGVTWPEATPFRLRLIEGSNEPVWDKAAGILTVQLPKSEVARVRVSSMFGGTLEEMELWNWLCEACDDGRISHEDSGVLKQGILNGRHWMFTPYREITLVHAVQQPLHVPELQRLQADRSQDSTFAYLQGAISVHAPSTAKLDIKAEWKEPRDDPEREEPETVNVSAHVMELPTTHDGQDIYIEGRNEYCLTEQNDALRIEHKEEFSDLLIFNGEQAKNSRRCVQRILGEPLSVLTSQQRRHLQEQLNLASKVAVHEFGDTKYRRVRYRVAATSRFREYFAPSLSPNQLVRESNEIEVDILSSARPAAPSVLYAVPTFGWNQTADADGNMTSERRGDGIRVYLNRPWWSSGDGEMLGVVCDDSVPFRYQDRYNKVTLWGRDPIWSSSEVSSPKVENFTNKKQIWWASIGGGDQAQIIGFDVNWDCGRKLWYCDLELDIGNYYFPFIRLALIRFQPNSLVVPGALIDLRTSPIVLVDLVQTAPNRTVTVTRALGAGVYNVSVSGVTYYAQSSLDGAEIQATSRMEALVQRRVDDIEDAALRWTDLPLKVELVPDASVPQQVTVWKGQISIPAEYENERLRLVIQEHELIPGDVPQGATSTMRERQIYLDTIPLYDVMSLAKQLLTLSKELTATGRHEEAVRETLAAVDELRGIHFKDNGYLELYASALYALATCLVEVERAKEAMEYAIEAVEMYRKLIEVDPDRFGPMLRQAEQLLASLK
ncbi:tetratricopeptide repeat protein [Paenibacillus alvei]|uniref:tetratricopeptide repeat protein n=1 Tax=Paenibacillus alvei TaxID=44250 RepID=UPI00041F4DF5|nr:tetratricopeptide repeat protein [Paenibacillus alvei]